jgi:predicted enzyme related to lactoylglutathione lyase
LTGSSIKGIETVLYPVSDLENAKTLYAALLGAQPEVDESYYVGFEVAGQHIGLLPGGGPQRATSPVAYWHVADIEAKLTEVKAAGAAPPCRNRLTTLVPVASWPASQTSTATGSG